MYTNAIQVKSDESAKVDFFIVYSAVYFEGYT